MRTEPGVLIERLKRLATVLDLIMPNCASLVRDALDIMNEQAELLYKKQSDINKLCLEISEWKHKYYDIKDKE